MYIQCSFENGPRTTKLLLFQLPLRISHPIIEVHSVAPDIIFKLPPLSSLEFVELLQVGKTLGRGLQRDLLTVNRLAQELLRGYLHRRGSLVLDLWRSSRCLHDFDGCPGGFACGYSGDYRQNCRINGVAWYA